MGEPVASVVGTRWSRPWWGQESAHACRARPPSSGSFPMVPSEAPALVSRGVGPARMHGAPKPRSRNRAGPARWRAWLPGLASLFAGHDDLPNGAGPWTDVTIFRRTVAHAMVLNAPSRHSISPQRTYTRAMSSTHLHAMRWSSTRVDTCDVLYAGRRIRWSASRGDAMRQSSSPCIGWRTSAGITNRSTVRARRRVADRSRGSRSRREARTRGSRGERVRWRGCRAVPRRTLR